MCSVVVQTDAYQRDAYQADTWYQVPTSQRAASRQQARIQIWRHSAYQAARQPQSQEAGNSYEIGGTFVATVPEYS